MNRRRILSVGKAFTAVEWHPRPFADDSSAIHRCNAYGIVQGRLLHAYATPTIFNYDRADIWYEGFLVVQESPNFCIRLFLSFVSYVYLNLVTIHSLIIFSITQIRLQMIRK